MATGEDFPAETVTQSFKFRLCVFCMRARVVVCSFAATRGYLLLHATAVKVFPALAAIELRDGVGISFGCRAGLRRQSPW